MGRNHKGPKNFEPCLSYIERVGEVAQLVARGEPDISEIGRKRDPRFEIAQIRRHRLQKYRPVFEPSVEQSPKRRFGAALLVGPAEQIDIAATERIIVCDIHKIARLNHVANMRITGETCKPNHIVRRPIYVRISLK